MEVERLQQEYDFDVHFAPFLLRPETPLEGMPARRFVELEAPPTPQEQRGEALGIKFTRGRKMSSYSHLALEAGEFALKHAPHEIGWAYHKRLFKAYFEELENLADVDVLVRLADESGLDGKSLREVLKDRSLEAEVDEGIAWSRQIGVTAIPTFVFNQRTGIVGAQELPAFREMMERVGNPPKSPTA